jgi:hypothetical protein
VAGQKMMDITTVGDKIRRKHQAEGDLFKTLFTGGYVLSITQASQAELDFNPGQIFRERCRSVL